MMDIIKNTAITAKDETARAKLELILMTAAHTFDLIASGHFSNSKTAEKYGAQFKNATECSAFYALECRELIKHINKK